LPILNTFQELKSYGMSVITSVVSQNTTGVQDIYHLPTSVIETQLDSVLDDMDVHAFKTGMIADREMMEVIREKTKNLGIPYVMDHVMVTTSAETFIEEDARDCLRDELLTLTNGVKTNIPEDDYLLNRKIEHVEDMQKADKDVVREFGEEAALIKGGHNKGDATDFLYDGNELHTFSADRVDTKHTH